MYDFKRHDLIINTNVLSFRGLIALVLNSIIVFSLITATPVSTFEAYAWPHWIFFGLIVLVFIASLPFLSKSFIIDHTHLFKRETRVDALTVTFTDILLIGVLAFSFGWLLTILYTIRCALLFTARFYSREFYRIAFKKYKEKHPGEFD